MQNKLLSRATGYLAAKRRHRVWTKVVSTLGCVVVFCTTYALILPAITLERDIPYCGYETEHTHTEDCYTQELLCALEESEGHVHSEECYETQEVLICELEESEEHVHTEDCYESREVLICELEESEGHVHTEDCYGEPELTCGLEEHTHTDECYINPAPAQEFSGEAGGVTVTVSAPDGAFPAGTEMTVSEADEDAVQAAAAAVNADAADVQAVDISFSNAEGGEIEPAVPISVRLESALVADTENAVVVHVDNEANAEIVEETTVEGEAITFEADAFSVYAIVPATDERYIYEFYVAGDSDDGSGTITEPVETQIITAGDVLTRPEVPDIPTQYTAFIGWYIGGTKNETTSVWEGGTQLTFGALDADALKAALDTYRDTEEYKSDPANTEDAAIKVIKVHARFADLVTVTFMMTGKDSEGKDVSQIVTEKTVRRGGSVTINDVIATPPNTDLGFMGWSYESEDSERLNNIIEDNSITVSADTTLYAVFDQGHTLTFVNGEGATHTTSQFVASGKITTQPSAPQRAGYTFDDWYTGTQDDNGNVSYDATPFEFGKVLDENTTIYAKWTANENVKYTVVFWYENAEDDKYSYAGSVSETAAAGTEVSSAAFEDTDFTGRDDTHFTYNSKRTETKTVAGDGSTVLNVYFTRNTYTLTFRNEAGNTTYQVITAKYQAYIGDQWPLAGQQYGSYTKVPDKLYYWSFPRDDGTDKKASQATKIYTVTDEICRDDGKLTLTAKTSDSVVEFTINYMMESLTRSGTPHDGTYYENDSRYTQTVQYPSTQKVWTYKEIDGFTHSTRDSENMDENRTANLYYERNRNTITFNDNHGNNIVTIEDVMFEMPLKDVTYEGKSISEIVPTYYDENLAQYYDFKGWYTTAGCYEGTEANFDDDDATMPNNQLIFYAKWVPKTFTVTYDPNGGLFSDNTTQPKEEKVPYNEKTVDRSEEVTRNGGYTLRGWYYTDALGEYVPWNFDDPITGDLTLTAEWYIGVSVTIQYISRNPETGEWGVPKWAQNDTSSYLDGAEVRVRGEEVSDESFVGWRLGVPDTSEREEGKTYNDMTGTFYAPGDFLTISEQADLADGGVQDKIIVLYAVYYTPPTVSLTFDANEGAFGNGVTTDEEGNYTLSGLVNNEGVDLDEIPTPTRKGYKFLGWATVQTPGATDTVYTADGADTKEIYIDDKGDNILYAVWEELVDLTVKKVDGTNNTTPLEGAQFTLSYTVTNPNEDEDESEGESQSTATTYYWSSNGWTTLGENETASSYAQTTSDKGTFTFSGLEKGQSYTLTEVKAPNGYNLLAESITLSVTAEGSIAPSNGYTYANGVLTVPNTAGYELPSTGGEGAYLYYTFGGLLLTAGALMYGYKLRRKGERRSQD